MPFCSKCGTEIKVGSCYCSACGQIQVESTPNPPGKSQSSVTEKIKPKYRKLLLLITLVVLIFSLLFTVDYFAFNFIPVTKTIDWNIGGTIYGKYSGTVRYKKPHGKGNFLVTSGIGVGTEYIGDWLNGRRHGFGVQTTPDGGSGVGEWVQDGLVYGTYYYVDGATYHGHFKDGLRHGEGTLTASDASIYRGHWKEGFLHGLGTWITRDAKYVGGFQNGLWHGQGTMTFYDGTVLEGIWLNGEFTGIYPDTPPPQLRNWGN